MFDNQAPITKNIILLNSVIFALMYLPLPAAHQLLVSFPAYFPLSSYFRWWQVVTHMFMHGSLMHILFNMLTLLSFGPTIERLFGGKRFTLLYFLSGLGAFLLFNLWNYYLYTQAAGTAEGDAILNTPMVGASGAIFGVMTAFATLFPDTKLYFMFIPVPISAKYILPVIIVVSIYLGFSDQMSGIAHFAHVGGAIVGWIMARSWKKKLPQHNFYR
ncbi:rhomboid family intramembrane serine protease [Cruoricaptor ignavus]|uniref:rhomboid family intramembrane serine protease n=1 Tax=Cruoricaptor ignavus TaxID=1118202 RepID=UPI00370D17CF